MIICLSGFKKSGKDTLAAYMIEQYGAIRVALADPLKDSVAEEFGIDRSSLDDPKGKESPILSMPVDPKDAYSKMIAEFMFKEFRDKDGRQPVKYVTGHKFHGIFSDATSGQLYQTPRSLAILKGSTNRSVRSDFWTNKAFEVIQANLNAGELVVVTDLRYKSEVKQFSERFPEKVVFVRINRFATSPSNDPSELDLVDHKFDHYIDNTNSLQNAYEQLDSILFSLRSQPVSGAV